MNLTIKAKLIFVVILLLITLVAGELFTTYIDSRVNSATQLMLLRQSQISQLSDLKTKCIELTLAAMDAIIDKDSGVIADTAVRLRK